MSVFHDGIMSSFHHAIISSFHPSLIVAFHHFIMSSFHDVIMSSFHHAIISSFHPSLKHFIISSFDDWCWWLMIDDWWLMIDDWWLMIDDWWLMIDDWWLINHQYSIIIQHQSSIINHQSSIINPQSSIINHQSSIIHHRSSIVAHPSSLKNHQPAAVFFPALPSEHRTCSSSHPVIIASFHHSIGSVQKERQNDAHELSDLCRARVADLVRVFKDNLAFKGYLSNIEGEGEKATVCGIVISGSLSHCLPNFFSVFKPMKCCCYWLHALQWPNIDRQGHLFNEKAVHQNSRCRDWLCLCEHSLPSKETYQALRLSLNQEWQCDVGPKVAQLKHNEECSLGGTLQPIVANVTMRIKVAKRAARAKQECRGWRNTRPQIDGQQASGIHIQGTQPLKFPLVTTLLSARGIFAVQLPTIAVGPGSRISSLHFTFFAFFPSSSPPLWPPRSHPQHDSSPTLGRPFRAVWEWRNFQPNLPYFLLPFGLLLYGPSICPRWWSIVWHGNKGGRQSRVLSSRTVLNGGEQEQEQEKKKGESEGDRPAADRSKRSRYASSQESSSFELVCALLCLPPLCTVIHVCMPRVDAVLQMSMCPTGPGL